MAKGKAGRGKSRPSGKGRRPARQASAARPSSPVPDARGQSEILTIKAWMSHASGLSIPLSSIDLYVYIRIYQVTNNTRGIYCERQRDLAAVLGVSVRTVRGALARLNARGHIRRCAHGVGWQTTDRYIAPQPVIDEAVRRYVLATGNGDVREERVYEWMWASASSGGLGLRLGSVAALVYSLVWEVTHDGVGELTMSQAKMAEQLGVSRKAVNEALASLEEAGLISSRPLEPPKKKGKDGKELPATGKKVLGKVYSVDDGHARRAMLAIARTPRPPVPDPLWSRRPPARPRRPQYPVGEEGDRQRLEGAGDEFHALLKASPVVLPQDRAMVALAGWKRLLRVGVEAPAIVLAYDNYLTWIKRRKARGEEAVALTPERFLTMNGSTLARFVDKASEQCCGRPLDPDVMKAVVDDRRPQTFGRARGWAP